MKYFTPEFQNDVVISEMCFQVRKTQKAAVFSEKFYEKLYILEKKAYLKHCKRAAKFEHRGYDEAAASKEFDANYEENLQYVKANLPDELLSRVADIRVLALGSVTYEMADELTRFCGRIDRKCKKIEDEYDCELERVAELTGWYTVNLLNYLIGAPIADIREEDGKIVLVTSGEYTGNAVKITLHDAKMIKRDSGLVEATILRHELTLSEDAQKGFSFSLLCSSGDGSLCTLSILSSNIEADEL